MANDQERPQVLSITWCIFKPAGDEILDVVAKLGSANLDSSVDIIAFDCLISTSY